MRPRARLVAGALAALAVLAANSGYVSSRLGLLHGPRQVLEADHHRYIAMAHDPPGRLVVEAPVPPFCWRVFVPGLVWGLGRSGMSIDAGYYASTGIFLFGFLLALFHYLGQRGLGTRAALIGVLLAGALPGGVRWYAYQYWMPDPLCLLLVVLSLVLIEGRRPGYLLPVALLGVATRESYVIVFPYLFLRSWRRDSLGSALRWTLIVAGPALALLLTLRWMIEPAASYDWLETLERMAAFRRRHLWRNQAYFMTAGTWGVLLPLALLFPLRVWAWLKTHLAEAAVLGLAYGSLLMANNTDRLLVYALPVVMPAILTAIERWGRVTGVGFLVPGLVVLVFQLFVYIQTPFHRLGVSVFQPTNWKIVAALALLWTLAQAGLVVAGVRQRRTGALPTD